MPEPAGRYGGVGKRLLARILDYILVAVVVAVVFLVVPGLGLVGPLGSVVSTVVAFGYFLALETTRGATFGKQLLGLTVTGESGGSPIGVDASFKRNWWMLVGLIGALPGALGLLASLVSLVIVIWIAVTISSDERNQGFHDRMGATLVLERA